MLTSPLRDRIRTVFLDRDGVVNRKMPEGRYVTAPADFVLYPGVARAIGRLNSLDIRVFIVTNQRGIALGVYSETQLAQVHQYLRMLLAAEGAHVDAIYHCPHHRDSCECRKPGTGMFAQAFHEFAGTDPGNSLMAGDSLSDIQAGQALGMCTVFIDGDPATQPEGAAEARLLATHISPSLAVFIGAHFG